MERRAEHDGDGEVTNNTGLTRCRRPYRELVDEATVGKSRLWREVVLQRVVRDTRAAPDTLASLGTILDIRTNELVT